MLILSPCLRQRGLQAGAARHPFAGRYSDNQIAQHCGVHRNTILSYRHDLAQIMQDTVSRTVTRGGSTYTMQTANIGRRKVGVGVLCEDFGWIWKPFQIQPFCLRKLVF